MTTQQPGTTGGQDSWAARHRVALGITGALVAAGMTAVWWVVVPDKAQATEGLQAAAIRYGHPATWALLALLGVLIAANAPKRIRSVLGALSLVAYAGFLMALLL